MGKNKQDTKSADKGSGAKGGKGKGKGDDDKDTKSSKGAQSINVRHILVSTLVVLDTSSYMAIDAVNSDLSTV
jgi:hypothetical protein